MDLKEWVHTPYHGKPYADSTLRGMKKEELIQIIRDYEHNYNALYEANERGIQAATKLLDAEERHRWVPVTERLPNGEALALNALKGSYGYHEYLLGYVGADSESDTGFRCENEGEILMNVTHWMPLPSTEGLDET